VTFRLYGPNNATCASPPAFTSTVALSGGAAQSAAFTPTGVGTYRWVATYDGDVNNMAVSGVCGDPTETRPVATPPAALPPTGAGLVWVVDLASILVLIGGLVRMSTRRRVP
jgi:hypothetical protein